MRLAREICGGRALPSSFVRARVDSFSLLGMRMPGVLPRRGARLINLSSLLSARG